MDEAQREAARDAFIETYCTYENPHAKEIERTIAQTSFRGYKASFAHLWSNPARLPEPIRQQIFSTLSRYLGGGILLDIGGGGHPKIASTAEEWGVKTYVDIDVLPENQVHIPYSSQIDSFHLQGDILREISKIRSQCSHVIINGIDYEIIFDTGHEKEAKHPHAYHRRTAEEVVRILPEGGLVFGVNSDASFHFEDLGLQPVSLLSNANSGTRGGVFAYTKQKKPWWKRIWRGKN